MKFNTFDLICTQRERFARDFFLFSFRKPFYDSENFKKRVRTPFSFWIGCKFMFKSGKLGQLIPNVKVARNKQRQQIDQPLLLRATPPTPHTERKTPGKVKLTTGRICFCSFTLGPDTLFCERSDKAANVLVKKDLNHKLCQIIEMRSIMSVHGGRWLHCLNASSYSKILFEECCRKCNLDLQNVFVFLSDKNLARIFTFRSREIPSFQSLSAFLSNFHPHHEFSPAGKAGAGKKHVEITDREEQENFGVLIKKNLFG